MENQGSKLLTDITLDEINVTLKTKNNEAFG